MSQLMRVVHYARTDWLSPCRSGEEARIGFAQLGVGCSVEVYIGLGGSSRAITGSNIIARPAILSTAHHVSSERARPLPRHQFISPD